MKIVKRTAIVILAAGGAIVGVYLLKVFGASDLVVLFGLVFLVYAVHAIRIEDLESEVQALDKRIDDLEELLESRFKAVWHRLNLTPAEIAEREAEWRDMGRKLGSSKEGNR